MKKILTLLAFSLVAFASHAQSTLTGDVNGDGDVSVTDVTLLVNKILGNANDNFIIANADVNSDGVITVTDVTKLVSIILEGSTPPSNLICPDNHHPHMIDLGLPSGIKWACCNVGADKPEGYGGYYAWGETEEKDFYSWSTYIHCDGAENTCNNLYDIEGTQYDVAHVKWGGLWLMPSRYQIDELFDDCTHSWITFNGVKGRLFVGTNGNKIFLPAAGSRWDDVLTLTDICAFYWTSSQMMYDTDIAASFYFDYSLAYSSYINARFQGLPVRPIVFP